MTAVYVGLGVVVAIVIIGVAWTLTHTPDGYEDETGFHYGVKK